ncbi:MAG: hypothetical protein K8L97_11680 [Anaerolineae bacterium]|nr:hypothetical protein [Anaerolineae bacterium]
MRKSAIIGLWVLALVAALGVSAVSAQDTTPIELGSWVEGELTNATYEVKYSFEGKAGQIVLVEMLPKPGTYDLDPALILRDSDGDILGQDDDFSYPVSAVVAELAADETFIVLATRSGGSTGSSEGEYWIRVNVVEPLTSGAKVEATLTTNSEEETPNLFVIRPEESGEIKIGFSQEPSDLYASVELSQWVSDSYPTTVFSLDDTAKVSNASLSVNLEAGQFYILDISRSFGAYSFDEIELVVTISIS